MWSEIFRVGAHDPNPAWVTDISPTKYFESWPGREEPEPGVEERVAGEEGPQKSVP
jgi:hypothetical protein